MTDPMIYTSEEGAGLSPATADTSCSSSSASDSLLDSTSTESLGSTGTGTRLDPNSGVYPDHYYPSGTIAEDQTYPIVVGQDYRPDYPNGASWLNSKAPPFYPRPPPYYEFPQQKMMCSIVIDPCFDPHNYQGMLGRSHLVLNW